MTDDEFDEGDPDPTEFDIDELLNQERPERYDLADQEWMEPVVAKLRDDLLQRSAEEVAEAHARRLVHIREGVATQRLNTLLRRFTGGQFPIGFGEGSDWRTFYGPYLRAALLIGGHKVQFGVASAADVDEWVLEQRRADERDDERRRERIDGALAIAAALRAQGAGRVEDLRAKPE